MNSLFESLDEDQKEMLRNLLGRRDAALARRVSSRNDVSRSDAEQVMSVVCDELIDNLDGHGEPTRYGREVSVLLARFNAARIAKWPS